MRGIKRIPTDGLGRPATNTDAGRKIDLLEVADLLKVPTTLRKRIRRRRASRALMSLERRDGCYYMTLERRGNSAGRLWARPNAIEHLLPWDPKRGDALRADLDRVIERLIELEKSDRDKGSRLRKLEQFRTKAADLIATHSALASDGA